MSEQILSRLEAELKTRSETGLFRQIQVAPADLIDFSSNDYLGFSKRSEIREALYRQLERGEGWGSGGSRLLTGSRALHFETELLLADCLNAESALLFGSGFEANVGLLTAVARRGDLVLFDELCHASIRAGLAHTTARSLKFRHNDATDLTAKLENFSPKARSVFIVAESVYSMDGDAAPLPEYAELAKQYQAGLLLDEAHAYGVAGPGGAGLAAFYGLEEQCLARVVTFGKAAGCAGACIAGSKMLTRYLTNFCRNFIYTTAPSELFVAAIRAAAKLVSSADIPRAKIAKLRTLFDEEMSNAALEIRGGDAAILSIVTKGVDRTQAIAASLRKSGLLVYPILSPTVPEGSERIRICLHSFNSEADVKLLANELRAVKC